MDEKNRIRSVALRADNGSTITADGVSIEGFNTAAEASGYSTISLKDSNIKNINNDEVDELVNLLLDELEVLTTEAKKGNSGKKMLLVNILSQIGSGSVIGFLKSKGLID